MPNSGPAYKSKNNKKYSKSSKNELSILFILNSPKWILAARKQSSAF